MKNISYRVALGGIVSALCLFAMFLTGVFPVLYLVLPMIAGSLITIISTEINPKWAFLTYVSVSIASLFVTFDKEAALIFILFFGHYPILKEFIEKIKLIIPQYILKLVVYNFCIILNFNITLYIFGITEMYDEFRELGKYALWIFLAFTNIIFLLYDYSLSGCKIMYVKWLKPKITGKKH
jgi:hypothetical protein